MKDDVLKPSASLLAKLGSILVHSEELISKKGHFFDFAALQQVIEDREVKEWRRGMDKLALLPVKR